MLLQNQPKDSISDTMAQDAGMEVEITGMRAKMIDKISRVAFPVVFMLFVLGNSFCFKFWVSQVF